MPGELIEIRTSWRSVQHINVITRERAPNRARGRFAFGKRGSRRRANHCLEGQSDKAALDALAKRRGRNLHDEGITTIAIGGATKIRGFLDFLGPLGLNVKLAGLCDIGEERHFRRALQRGRFGSNLSRSDMERLGFYICEADLEDELIRSLGVRAILEVMEAQSDLGRFRIFRRQPEWHEQSSEAQVRR